MPALTDTLTLSCGRTLANRVVLAPMTNGQSHADGRLGDDEYRWLVMRAAGGFGLTMTCAAFVQREGVGFAGQLGIASDSHLEGLTRLAAGIKAHRSHAVVQLYHAGMRAPAKLTGHAPLCPSDDGETGARAMTRDEVQASIEAFVAAARRAERAGFDGVELHGAHGYLICEFLSPEVNRRDDDFGGGLENRSRYLMEVIRGVRSVCGPGFSLGVRLSPERFGMQLMEARAVVQRLMAERRVDYIDLSLWDCFKEPEDPSLRGRSLMSYFTDLERGPVRLGAAGKILSGTDAAGVMSAGMDFAVVGRAAVLHHDFPRKVAADPAFRSMATPVTPEYLHGEGLSDTFVAYMRHWKGFVTEPAEPPASS